MAATQKSWEDRKKLGKTPLPPKQRGKLGQAILLHFILFHLLVCIFGFVLGGKFPSFP